jgi:superoxide dismutase, Cu-Zn family
MRTQASDPLEHPIYHFASPAIMGEQIFNRTMNSSKLARVGCALIIIIVSGCAYNQTVHPVGKPGAGLFGAQNETVSGPKAVAYLNPAAGGKANGTVTFTAVPGGVRIQAGIMGLAPGLHAFRVQETGDCSAPADETSDLNSSHEVLGNFAADATGEIHLDFVDSQLNLTGANSILGHALTIHSGAEDDAGLRIACGVIQNK